MVVHFVTQTTENSDREKDNLVNLSVPKFHFAMIVLSLENSCLSQDFPLKLIVSYAMHLALHRNDVNVYACV